VIPRIFEGQPCLVVGGGPSLIGFDFGQLRGLNVIAINRAYEFIPDAPILWFTDWQFLLAHQAGLEGHAARFKCSAEWDIPDFSLPAWATKFRFTGLTGFDPRPDCLRHGNNGGYTAMHLGAHAGASALILLGFDMQHGSKGESHFHGGHGLMHVEQSLTQVMLPYFKTLKPGLDERSIAVLNASPESALRVWPRCSIQDGLATYRRLAATGAAHELSKSSQRA
jgi:hypothetical protein